MKIIKLAIIFYLFILLDASTISNTKCKCEQLFSQSDCLNQIQNCLWESDKCVTNSNPPNVATQNLTYCTQFIDSICQITIGCAWINKECQQFAGCTAYYYSQYTDCQYVSQQCSSDGVHCVDLGNCSDYKTKVACFKNQKNLLCYWNEDKCQDFTECNQLPLTLKSDKECRAQLSKCTVGEQNGCVESADNCEGHKLISQCVQNKSQTESCFWSDNKCLPLKCSNAPLTIQTHLQCNSFMKLCTTQQNGGCTNMTSCGNAKIEAACVKNQFDEPCIWLDNTCYDQVCSKAPNSFNTNEQCQKISKNCVTTQNGCIEQISCSSSTKEIGCIDMTNGTKCFWNGQLCVEKTCSNNTSAKSQAECEIFSNQCTFNISTSIGCVDKICENIIDQDQCTTDAYKNKCVWKSNCFTKACVFAPKSYQSHQECETYLLGCALDNSGYGCMNKMLSCKAYQSEKSCQKTQQGEECLWKNSTCVDKQCNMANSSITTTTGCQIFKSDCIVNNNQIGCMNLTSNCSDRQLQQNCEFGTSPICIWNNNKCVQQSCETANIIGSPNYLTIFNQQNCISYMNNCVLNNSSNGCITKPTSCSSLSINNCFVSIQNDCIWTGGQCKEKICQNLIGNNHSDCYNQYSQCTINSSLNGCIQIQKCQQYTIEQQCKISQSGSCIWTGTQCRDSGCSDSTDTNNFDTYEKCNQLNSQCTVLSKVNQQGCINKLSNCQEYKYDYQCYSTINQVECIWLQDQCQELQQINCSSIHLNTYSDANCSSILFRCKVNPSSSGCINKICTDYLYTTKDECEKIVGLPGCTLNKDQNRCIVKKDLCSDYSSDLSQCKYSKEGTCVIKNTQCLYTHVECTSLPTPSVNSDCSSKRDFCIMVTQGTNKSCSPTQCQNYTGGNLTFDGCQEFDYSCTINRTGTGCISMADTCTAGTTDNCTYSKNQGNCKWTGSGCKPIAIPSEKNCQLITDSSSNLTYDSCQKLSSYCSINRTMNACLNIQADCYQYTNLNDCYQSSRGRCIQNQIANLGASCMEMSNTIECDKIYLGESFTYTHNICQSLKSSCTNDSTTGCKIKTCSNVNTVITNHDDCVSWLSTCTFNQSLNSCVEQKLKCSEQNQNSCLWSQEGRCIVVNNECVKMTCNVLSNSYTTHNQCQTEYNKCTVANKGGCIMKLQNCSSYLTQIQCKYNYSNQKCWWNQSTMNCVDLKCEEIEKTNNYTSHNQCYNVSPSIKCTVDSTGLGCQSLKSCDLYSTQPECVFDSFDKNCIWNTNTLKCQYKQCNVALPSLNSHSQCQIFDLGCTVSVKLDDQQQQIIQGCQSLSPNCSDYLFEQQCFITKDNQKCSWSESSCKNLGCSTAPKTNDYSTHQACQTYLSNCTVSSDLLGCVDIPKKCTDISLEVSCLQDATGNQCFWSDSKCQIKTCSTAPSDQNTPALCQLWLPTCTAESINKCKRLSCEEYEFTTDSECKSAQSTCTTDGIKCVTRGTCQTLSEAGCIKSINDEQCYWIGNKCTLKECQIINKEKDCNISYNNVKCIWDKGNCRNIGECSDYNGTSHSECQKFNTSCTIGENSKCMKIKSCNDFTIKQQCFLGLDGPCRWIDKQSKCIQFTSCKSIQFTSDEECKQVSPLCTSDGSSCIAITLCGETNTIKGCVNGIDGECIKTVPTLNSSQPPICKLFTSCSDAYYLSHQDCQNASKSCTTDGLNGCINLSACNQYVNQASCKIDSFGLQQKDGQITSTGQCVWNQSGECKNQSCTDLTGTSHEQCTLQLSICTYDGSACINKQNCGEYKSQESCSIAYGLEGKCNWNNTLGTCQMFMCSSITNGNTLQQCQQQLPSCITDGSKCINKEMCSSYTTKIACTIGGTDGICVWNGQSCSLMQSCTQADLDQEACLSAKDRCAFKYASGVSTSSCYAHTCETYQKTNGKCISFSDWNKSTKRACSIVDGRCQEIELGNLDQSQCFIVSEYTYTWNVDKSKCLSCNAQQEIKTNQTKNETNSSTKTQTPTSSVDTFGYNLEIVLMLLILIQ